MEKRDWKNTAENIAERSRRFVRAVALLWLCAFVLVMAFLAVPTCKAWTRTDTLRVTATGNDGRIDGTTFSTTDVSNIWGKFVDPAIEVAWWRVMSKIPSGRSITSVIPIIAAGNGQQGRDTSYFRFSKTNNVTAPTSTATYNAIAKTNDSVRTIGTGTWVEGTRYRLEDVKTAFKETYDQGDCDSGEYVMLTVRGANVVDDYHYRKVYDYGEEPSYAFWLEVVHTDGTPDSSNGRRRKVLRSDVDVRFPVWGQWGATCAR